MNLQERLQKLSIERQKIIVHLHEINGAMKILEQQILETQETPEASQPSDIEALTQPEEVAS